MFILDQILFGSFQINRNKYFQYSLLKWVSVGQNHLMFEKTFQYKLLIDRKIFPFKGRFCRFQAPEKLPKWEGILDAGYFGPICIQPLESDVWDLEMTSADVDENSIKVREKIKEVEGIIDEIRKLKSNSSGDHGPSATAIKDVVEMRVPKTSVLRDEEINRNQSETKNRRLEMTQKFMRDYIMSEDCLTLNIYSPLIVS